MPDPLTVAGGVEHTTRKHHPYSPSKLQYFEACPKFSSSEGSNEAAERGSMMHEASETLDFSKLTQSEADAVRAYLGFIDEAKAELGEGVVDLIEIKVAVDDLDTTTGFLDRALLSADGLFAHVIDLKTGYGDIEHASNNLQGLAYALGIRRRYPTVRTIKVSFVTPRQATFSSTHEFTADQLDAEYRRIVQVVKNAKRAKRSKGFDMARPSTATCRFCSHYLTKCTKSAGVLTTVGKHVPVSFIDPETMMTTDDPAELSRVLDLLKFLDEFQKPIKNRITAMAMQGVEIPGYSLVTVAEREVVSEEAALTALTAELIAKGVSDDDIGPTLKKAYSFKLSAAERVVSDLAARGEKRNAIAAFRDRLREAGAVMDSTPKVFLKRELKLVSAEARADALGITADFGGGWM